jgi:hypothetical protein
MLFTNNDTSSLGKSLINTSHSIIWGLDLAHEDWLDESWLSSELSSVQDSSGSWDDLTTTSVDSISVKGNIHNVESNTSHVLLSHDCFFGGPLEGSFARVLNFVKILDGFGLINKKVWTCGLWTEAPDLSGIIDIPTELVGELSGSIFLFLLG